MEKFVKLNGKTIYESDVKKMTKSEINSLIRECTNAIQDISVKRDNYKVENEEDLNSPEFCKRMRSYKTAIVRTQQAVNWMSDIKKQKNESDHVDREHWFFCFFYAANKLLPRFIFNKIKTATINKAGFDISCDIGGQNETH